jgi:hypothetical protein
MSTPAMTGSVGVATDAGKGGPRGAHDDLAPARKA